MGPQPQSIARLVVGVSLALATTSCTTTAPAPDPEPPPAPAVAEAPTESGVESFDELEETYAKGLDTLHGMVESMEDRRPEILARVEGEIERDRAEVARLDAEILAIEQEMSSVAERLAGVRRDLQAVRESAGEKAGRLLAEEADELAARLAELGDTRGERKARRDELAASVEQRAALGDDALFAREVQTVYRETLQLQRDYYLDGITLARRKLAGQEAGFLVDHYQERIRQRERELGRGAITEDVVRTFRRQQQSDRRMEAALYLAYVLEVRFPTSRHELELISIEERENLELLTEALDTGWDDFGELRIHVDGHADSQVFRNVRACVSATRNVELSRQRAVAVRDFLSERLGAGSRFAVDWFGNFALQKGAAPTEADNRRIELRISSEGQEGSGAHSRYFDLRREVAMQGRTFVREPGRWVESACAKTEPASRVEHLSKDYDALMARLGLDPDLATEVDLGEGRALALRLGNQAVLADGDACVEVVPCTGP